MAQTNEHLLDGIYSVTKEKGNDIVNFYKKWAPSYDSEMVEINYTSPKLAASTLADLKLSTDVRIVDVGAGTGAVARNLKPKGYTNIDALDCSTDMLEHAKKEGLYRNYIVSMIEGLNSVSQIKDGTYDVVTCSGVFTPNHLGTDAFPELLRILKSGGIIIMVRGLQYEKEYHDLGPGFFQEMDKLTASGKWKRRREDIYCEDHHHGYPALVHIMEKLA